MPPETERPGAACSAIPCAAPGPAQAAPAARSRRRAGLLAAIGLGLAMAGCTSVPQVEEMVVRMNETSDLKVLAMQSVRRNGLLTVQATVRNDGADRSTGYRFRWLDAAGMKVWDDEAWKPIATPAGFQFDLVGVAPTPEATDFRLEFGAPRPFSRDPVR